MIHQLLFVDDRPCSSLRPCSLNYSLLKRRDIQVVLLRIKGDPLGPEYIEATRDTLKYYLDPSNDFDVEVNSFDQWCREWNLSPNAFCCLSEPRQEYWQQFARALNLPALDSDVAHALRHKPTMKRWIRALGLKTTDYAPVEEIDDILKFAKIHRFPVVLKPVDGWGALSTFIIESADQIDQFSSVVASSKMMVEAFVANPEYECCALIADGRVLDIFPSSMPSSPFEASQGALNANISLGCVRDSLPIVKLHDIMQRLTTGFRLRRGYLHSELFISHDAQSILISELALRYPGCEIAKNHGLAYNFDIAQATIDTYLGMTPPLVFSDLRCVGDLLLPYRSGKVQRVTREADLLQLPNVLEAHVGVATGDVLPEIPNASFNCSGWVIVTGRNPREIEDSMRRIIDLYELRTERI